MNTIPNEFKLLASFRTGSNLYGTSLPTSDVDTRGVFLPTANYILGYLQTMDQIEDKVTDTVYYNLLKFFMLASECNPNIVEYFFIPDTLLLSSSKEWESICENRNLFLTKQARWKFAGYAFNQLRRIKNHRGWLINPPTKKPERGDFGLTDKKLVSTDQIGAFNKMLADYFMEIAQFHPLREQLEEMLETRDFMSIVQRHKEMDLTALKVLLPVSDNFIEALDKEKRYTQALREWNKYQEWKKNRNPDRAKLEAKYGYDTKHTLHLVRLLEECEELLTTGTITFPRPNADFLLAIRNGIWKYDEMIEYLGDIDTKFNKLYAESTLPKEPNRVAIEKMYIQIVESHLRTNSIVMKLKRFMSRLLNRGL